MSAPIPLDVNELAARLYIELSSRVTLAPAQADKAKPSPDTLARLAFKLADAFKRIADERSAEPVVEKYEVKLSDIGG